MDTQAVEARMSNTEFDDTNGWEMFSQLQALHRQLNERLHGAHRRLGPLLYAVEQLRGMDTVVTAAKPPRGDVLALQARMLHPANLANDALLHPDNVRGHSSCQRISASVHLFRSICHANSCKSPSCIPCP